MLNYNIEYTKSLSKQERISYLISCNDKIILEFDFEVNLELDSPKRSKHIPGSKLLIEQFKEVFLLTLEINSLKELLDLLEKNKNSEINHLRCINDLIYCKKNLHKNKLTNLLEKATYMQQKYKRARFPPRYIAIDSAHNIQLICNYVFDSQVFSNYPLGIHTSECIYKRDYSKLCIEYDKHIEDLKIFSPPYTMVNSLNKDIFCINPELLKYFSANKNTLKNINANNNVYLISLNLLYNKNNSSPTLIYKYLDYNDIFTPSLISFIEEIHKTDPCFFPYHSQFFIADKNFISLSLWEKIYKNISTYPCDFDPDNFIQTLLSHRTGPLYLDIEQISDFIEILYRQDNIKFMNLITKYEDELSIFKNQLPDTLNTPINFNSNKLQNYLFLVKDKATLLTKFKDLNVNKGVQKKRGAITLIESTLGSVDECFRKSLYSHVKQIANYKYVNFNRFSFKNIHKIFNERK